MYLDMGYYIEGRLEAFSKEQYFDNLLGIYIPESRVRDSIETYEVLGFGICTYQNFRDAPAAEELTNLSVSIKRTMNVFLFWCE